MQKFLLFLLLLAGTGLSAQIVLEDFEGDDGTITWEAVNGVYAGIVANPEDTTGRNPSANVGSYTKSGEHEFSQLRGTFAEPLDLSTNSRFSIQVYAGAKTAFIMKLVGVGEEIEVRANIAVANQWRTYSFDLSGVSASFRATQVLLFFDPGVMTSTDTYLFDNLIAYPAGPCAGTEVDETVIDDFECQRNASYGASFDDLEVVVNPAKEGINTSDSVGRYTDSEGPFVGLVVDFEGAIDLSVNNQICMKVRAPVAGELRFKLEGGNSTPVEMGTQITADQTEQWIEICQSFSGSATGNFGQITIFFNIGADGTEGDVYFIDDITITPTPAAEAIEDFEGGATLGWGPQNDNAVLNGTFSTIVNPDMTGNTSATVGSYRRGTSKFSTLTAVLPNGIDLSGNPQLNLDVWSPVASVQVTLQLVSATAGPKSATATVDAAQEWQTLSFNFEDFADVTDFESVNILFAPDTESTDIFLFDNLIQGAATVDACADVEVNAAILDDFECQRNATYTLGAGSLTAIDNPDAGVNSPNRSTRVGQFIDEPGGFNALVVENDSAIDLRLRNQFSATVWAPVAGQLLFKLEGAPNAPNVEKFVTIDTLNAWSTYSVDFSEAAGMGYSRIVLFFGAGTNNATANTYYIDNIRLGRADFVNSCVSTFEDVDFSVIDWQYFANGAFSENDFIVSDNPDSSGINKSLLVGTFEEAADGEEFAGMFANPEAPISLPNGNKIVTMKVYMEVAGTVVFKLEQGLDGAPGSGDVPAEYTTPGEWQELEFDMSSLPDGARYARMTLIMNRFAIPATPLTHYFDDIAVGGGDCANLVSIFSPTRIADLRVYPNPIINELTIENPDAATSFTLTNMLGQQVEQLRVDGARTQVQWPLEMLPKGTYLLTAQDRGGRLVARSMVIKR